MSETSSKKGKVVLVGAGPGDEGLLTLKGKAWLEQADVIVYDHLANANLTRFAKPGAELVYAGKKAGHATLTQAQINDLLIRKAREGKTVARLKGGDPFIFGRGGEEAQALKRAGIPFAVVPGVSSPEGVSAYAGIPLTHRDLASNISIITGSNEKGQDDIRIDWDKIATRSGTLVFLMGARKLPQIVENLVKHGKNPDTPVAVIQWGTTPKQRTWTGTLRTIADIALREKISPPALTVIGEVVNLKRDVDWFESLPLFGKTVVVTRAEEQAGPFVEILREKGADPLSFPVIQTFPPSDWGPLDTALDRLDQYHGAIFTSVNGVKYFMERLKAKDKDIRELKGVRLYAIGPKTGDAVRALGIRAVEVPEKFVAESLLESMGKENVAGKRFLLPRAEVARETLPDRLRELGATADVVPAYQTLPPDRLDERLADLLRDGAVDAVAFTASSTVKNFLGLLGPELRPLLENVAMACIGPITARTAESLGLKVDVMPEEYTVEALADAIEDYFARKKTPRGA
ncbi:MAG: uroporphyrinogen-III C-methyltransferase [Nitrospinae bacterium]|nr:uroporphyrinogen-III C-methyltransferase [Nitrospinota bacterium]